VTGPIDPRRLTTLYRLYGADDVLLYVGTSVAPQDRWEQHARNKLWWSSVQRATVEWHPHRAAALTAEREAIRSEKPLHNDKATPDEASFPYEGNRGPTAATLLRRAVTEARAALDRLAVAVDRAALGGMDLLEIAETAGIDYGDVVLLARRLNAGGGSSALID